MTTNKPIHDLKDGRVRAAIWANETKDGTRLSFTFERLYKQGTSWKGASSFYVDDIPRLQKVLAQVKGHLTEQPQAAGEEG